MIRIGILVLLSALVGCEPQTTTTNLSTWDDTPNYVPSDKVCCITCQARQICGISVSVSCGKCNAKRSR